MQGAGQDSLTSTRDQPHTTRVGGALGNSPSLGMFVSRWLTLSIAIALLLYWLFPNDFSPKAIGIDDAQIYFRYAIRVLSGDGLVFNQGGERVEGFSSPLWMLLVAVVFAVSRFPEFILVVVNVLLLAASLAAIVVAVESEFRARSVHRRGLIVIYATVAAFVLTFTYNCFTAWSVLSVLDTGLFSFLLTISVVTTTQALTTAASRTFPAYLSLILLVWSRPEGPYLAIAIVTTALVLVKALALAPQTPRGLAMSVLASCIALFGGRMLYFGYPLPNTYYAKVGDDIAFNFWNGVAYISRILNELPYFYLLLISVGYGIFSIARYFNSHIRGSSIDARSNVRSVILHSLIATASLGLIAITIVHGGDHFICGRMLQPIWPLLILGILSIVVSERILRMRLTIIVPALLVLPTLDMFHRPFGIFACEENALKGEISIAERGRIEGAGLGRIFAANNFSELPKVASVTVGGFAYSYPGPVLDLLGLNSVRMAHATRKRYHVRNHAAFDPSVLFELLPPFISLSFCEMDSHRPFPANGFYLDLLKRVDKTEKFKQLYVPIVLQSDRFLPQGALCGFLLRDSKLSFGPSSTNLIKYGQGDEVLLLKHEDHLRVQ